MAHRQGGHNLFAHQIVNKSPEVWIGNGLAHEFEAGQIAKIGKRRMAAIEHAKFHQFKWLHV